VDIVAGGAREEIDPLPDVLRARILANACGWEDADDMNYLRADPGLKFTCGRLPDSGRDLCSQPIMSRRENAPTSREMISLMRVMVGSIARATRRRPTTSRSTSTTPSTWCMAIRSCQTAGHDSRHWHNVAQAVRRTSAGGVRRLRQLQIENARLKKLVREVAIEGDERSCGDNW